MKISYDKEADAMTIKFMNKTIVKDVAVSEGVFAGFSKEGDLVEIQMIDLTNQGQPWLTVDSVAKLLGKSERTILRWIEKGRLEAKKVGKEYRIKPEALEEFENAG